MCGICGIIHRDRRPASGAQVKVMLDKLVHRGPDSEGMFCEENVGLGIRRLAIIDVEGGKQPISNEDGSVVTVFNGEIYNFRELQKELTSAGHHFKTKCDTEVLVHLYEEFGENMLSRLNGMFTFAIFDRKKKRIFLARDRLGVKPLYYTLADDTITFASEIKSILALRPSSPDIDMEALHHYLTFRFVPSPLTLFKNIRKLPPGHFMLYNMGRNVLEVRQYWDPDLEPSESQKGNMETDRMRSMVQDAVNARLVSDVPLGLMLSGGIDSSVIGLCMSQTVHPISTFTIDYREDGPHCEGPYAQRVSSFLGTEHHEITVTLEDFMTCMHDVVYAMDEPVADPASLAVYQLCRFAKKHISVLLTGVGGDEVFGGYPVYREAVLRHHLRNVPKGLLRGITPLVRSIPQMPGRNLIGRLQKTVADTFLGSSFVYGGLSEAAKRLIYSLDLLPLQSAYDSHSVIRRTAARVPGSCPLKQMMYVDLKHWLGDSHLIMLDKMSMAHSVELREPFLDHRLVEWGLNLPMQWKLNMSDSKIILKKGYERALPPEIIHRPKRGFSTPIHLWLNRSPHSFLDFLTGPYSRSRPMFRRTFVEDLLKEHQARGGDHSATLFSLVVLENWMRAFSVRAP